MKSIEITLQQLFDFIGHEELSYEEFKPLDEEIYVLTPSLDYTKLRGIIKKQDNKIKLSNENVSFICGEKHILISDEGNEVFAKDCSKIQTLDGPIEITSKEFVEHGDVYDIALDAPHLYVTPNGVVHHNTSLAHAICNEMNADVLFINASLENGIDTIRDQIQQFASTYSFTDGTKVVILDEADGLTANAQLALRGFIEAFSKNCRFIFTCNYKNKIIEAIHSRTTIIEFTFPKEQKTELAKTFFTRACQILDLENIKYDQKVIASLITKHFPDYRRILNELQKYSASGEISVDVLSVDSDESFKRLIECLKTKNFADTRKWVGLSEFDPIKLYSDFYAFANTYVKPESIPQLVLILADYQYKAGFVVDQELNLVAALTEIMSSIQFK